MWQNLHKMQNDRQPEGSQLYYLQNERTTFKPILNGNVLVVTLFFKVPQFFLLNNSHLKGNHWNESKNNLSSKNVIHVFIPKSMLVVFVTRWVGLRTDLFPFSSISSCFQVNLLVTIYTLGGYTLKVYCLRTQHNEANKLSLQLNCNLCICKKGGPARCTCKDHFCLSFRILGQIKLISY